MSPIRLKTQAPRNVWGQFDIARRLCTFLHLWLAHSGKNSGSEKVLHIKNLKFFYIRGRNFEGFVEDCSSPGFYSLKVVSKLEITDVRLRRVNTEGRMKAIASITIDHEFVVHDIRIIDGNNGIFVAMPSKRTPDGEFRDIAHPITSSTREKIQRSVLEEFNRTGSSDETYEEAGAS